MRLQGWQSSPAPSSSRSHSSSKSFDNDNNDAPPLVAPGHRVSYRTVQFNPAAGSYEISQVYKDGIDIWHDFWIHICANYEIMESYCLSNSLIPPKNYEE
ncbi:hypothetical protein L1887_33171 [Cichorium endivia]|nr:hypothetical protein L1887_33171 [Cichorium endivia]